MCNIPCNKAGISASPEEIERLAMFNAAWCVSRIKPRSRAGTELFALRIRLPSLDSFFAPIASGLFGLKAERTRADHAPESLCYFFAGKSTHGDSAKAVESPSIFSAAAAPEWT